MRDRLHTPSLGPPIEGASGGKDGAERRTSLTSIIFAQGGRRDHRNLMLASRQSASSSLRALRHVLTETCFDKKCELKLDSLHQHPRQDIPMLEGSPS